MGNLSGKTAIVSGGSDGIGRAIAQKLAGEGAHVVICSRNAEKVSAAVKSISESGGSCEGLSLDVSDSEAYAQMISNIASKRGLDILVNNAAHVGMGMIADTELEGFQQNFRVNMDAPYMGTRAAMSAMSETGGSIINISSVNGDRAMQGMSGYGLRRLQSRPHPLHAQRRYGRRAPRHTHQRGHARPYHDTCNQGMVRS